MEKGKYFIKNVTGDWIQVYIQSFVFDQSIWICYKIIFYVINVAFAF